MTPERWQRVSDLYQAVLDRPAGERERFLTGACGDDSALRRDVLSLLAQDDQASPLDGPVWVPEDLLAADYNAGSPQPMRLAAGTRLGPYEIQSAIGAGGMGEVYRGRDTRLDRAVAIKVLAPDMAADAGFRARFDREAKTISQLDHPNICPLFDVGDDGGVAFLVMPLLEGESLLDRLRRGPLPRQEALRIATSLASALTYAHGRGVLHRDLKPQNVLLLADGRVQLLDFGVSKSQALETADADADTTPALTRFGQALGTPEYMSPEQLSARVVDGRSDMFSLGIVLYLLMTGEHPFRGSTAAVTSAAILNRPSPSLPVNLADVDRVLQRMLQKHAADRYPTMADCLAELRTLEHRASSRLGHRRPKAIAVSLAILAVLAVLVVLEFTRDRGAPPAAPAASTPTAVAAPTATALTFWLDVKPNADANAPVFQSAGEQRYPSGSRFRLAFLAPTGAHVYVLADDTPAPGQLTLLHPRADSPGPDTNGTITTDWIPLTGPPASERLWLVSSTMPVEGLDAVAEALRSDRDLGMLSNATTIERVRTMLGDQTIRARSTRDASNVRTLLSGGSVIVHRLDISHD